MLPWNLHSLRTSTLKRGVPTRLQSKRKLTSPLYPICEFNPGQEIMVLVEAWSKQPETRKLEVVSSYNKLATSRFLVHFDSFD
jgi:hypothetical protein